MKKIYVGAASILAVVALLILFIGSVAEDNTAPSIRVRSEDILYSVGCDDEVLLAGVSATDEKDGNVSEHIVVTNRSMVSENKVEIVTFTVSDAAGNVANKDVVFVVNDDGTFILADYAAYSVDMDTLEISIEGIGVVGKATGNVIESVTGDNDEDEEPSGEEQSTPEEPSSEEPSSEEPSSEEPSSEEPSSEEPSSEEQTTPKPTVGNDGKPVVVLETTEVKVNVGQNLTYANFYSKYIDKLMDDKDDSNYLHRKIFLVGDKNVDTSTPGTYKVGYYCKDSDGNKSETVYLSVVVE